MVLATRSSGAILSEEFLMSSSSLVASNVLLQVHGPGNTVLRGHLVRGVLDVLKLLGSQQHPVVDALQRTIKVLKCRAEVINDLDLLFKLSNNNQLLLQGDHLLRNDLLFVFGKSESHNLNVVLDLVVQAHNAVPGLVKQVLPLSQICESVLQSEPLLDLLDFFNSLLDLHKDCVVV